MRRATIVVQVDDTERANNDALRIDPDAGYPTFGPTLEDGTGTITHRWCSWAMPEDQYAKAEELFGTGAYGRRLFDGDKYGPADVLARCNLRIASGGEGP